ncbi:GNAT family N-acetyltransferase [Kitasatospora aburaviensis]
MSHCDSPSVPALRRLPTAGQAALRRRAEGRHARGVARPGCSTAAHRQPLRRPRRTAHRLRPDPPRGTRPGRRARRLRHRLAGAVDPARRHRLARRRHEGPGTGSPAPPDGRPGTLGPRRGRPPPPRRTGPGPRRTAPPRDRPRPPDRRTHPNGHGPAGHPPAGRAPARYPAGHARDHLRPAAGPPALPALPRDPARQPRFRRRAARLRPLVRGGGGRRGCRPDWMFTAECAGRIVGVSTARATRDPRTCHIDYTGVLRPWRGRGLARSLKLHAARRLAGHGVRTVHTEVEAGNAPMVAVNSALGYRWGPGHHRLVKQL